MPVFEDSLRATMEPCIKIGDERGDAYGDTWRLDNQVSTFLDATLRAIGCLKKTLIPLEKRLILLAALIDVKDSRMLGEWKADTVVDGLNYRAVHLDLMEKYLRGDS